MLQLESSDLHGPQILMQGDISRNCVKKSELADAWATATGMEYTRVLPLLTFKSPASIEIYGY